MTLENLLKIGRLSLLAPSRDDIQRLLEAAKRNLADAKVDAVSEESRFDSAYKCIMQCAMATLRASGYRTSTNQPGHHQTAIQALPLTIGLDSKTMVLLDTFRKQRNISDYNGDPISPSLLEACIAEAGAMLVRVEAWLTAAYPDLK
ncbi:DNA-binding protein [Pseudoduganella aquatica]|uniref:DNA-binding protein n=1 Tax=Pseudoduganella aquatica TaxID=2660641 RepID=A0A7X4KLV2_9BURK|nr:DNA-binding protein [Pseudoduganella aquatica]MYN06476.1 DNA-binding protein [Pseudoduganella aquatica]